MAALDITQFPLVEIQAVANAQNEWVALTLRLKAFTDDATTAWHSVFDTPDLLTAVAPLDCVVFVDALATLTPALLTVMPANRVVFVIKAEAMADDATRKQTLALHDMGYRVMIDGPLAEGVKPAPTLRAVTHDCRDGVPPCAAKKFALIDIFGPHMAYNVNNGMRHNQCVAAGFAWFSGDYPLHPAPPVKPNDGTSRKRLLNLLGLVARDAESRELEALLKQDPALSYHLLKLVNSAAFAMATPITSFGQAINLLGRRQLQRWLQLLLYARQQQDGITNPLLPLAALRAAQLEALCKLQGGDRDAQDLAFMTGVFALLDVLFEMPMTEIVGALSLAPSAADALLAREGRLGDLLRLTDQNAPSLELLLKAGVEPAQYWQSQLHAYHWAIQVSRNL